MPDLRRFPALLAALALAACADATRMVEPPCATDCGGPGATVQRAAGPIDLNQVVHGEGRFVAIGSRSYVERMDGSWILTPFSDSAVVVWSDDGVDWARAEMAPAGGGLAAVTYGNGLFLAAGYDLWRPERTLLLRSHDGARWEPVPGAPQVPWRSLAFGDGTFLASYVDPRGPTSVVMRSSDGVEWERTLELPGWAHRLTYGGGVFLLYGEARSVWRSTDGRQWTRHDVDPLLQVHHLRWLDGRFVGSGVYDCCYGEIADAVIRYSLFSTDGERWEIVRRDDRLMITGLAFGHGRYVAAAHDAAYVSESPLSGWTAALTAPPNAFGASSRDWITDVLFAEDRFVAIGRRHLWSSADGREWSSIPIPE